MYVLQTTELTNRKNLKNFQKDLWNKEGSKHHVWIAKQILTWRLDAGALFKFISFYFPVLDLMFTTRLVRFIMKNLSNSIAKLSMN